MSLIFLTCWLLQAAVIMFFLFKLGCKSLVISEKRRLASLTVIHKNHERQLLLNICGRHARNWSDTEEGFGGGGDYESTMTSSIWMSFGYFNKQVFSFTDSVSGCEWSAAQRLFGPDDVKIIIISAVRMKIEAWGLLKPHLSARLSSKLIYLSANNCFNPVRTHTHTHVCLFTSVI